LFVAVEGALPHLIARGVIEPGVEVVSDGELARVGEDDALASSARAWSLSSSASFAVAP
jgi:hypothetical protein